MHQDHCALCSPFHWGLRLSECLDGNGKTEVMGGIDLPRCNLYGAVRPSTPAPHQWCYRAGHRRHLRHPLP